MLTGHTFLLILCIVFFLIIIIAGNELFAIMVDEQFRYLRLIISYAPLPATVSIPSRPEPVARHVTAALGENKNQVGCVHIRHAGRIRYGKSGRWMNMEGEAFLSPAVPAFVWYATISDVPGIWLEAFDYYIDHQHGMNLNLFSVFPLDNGHSDTLKNNSLFQYQACTPLFPMIYGSYGFISWENVDDSAAKATIRDGDRSVDGIAHFDDRGMIGNVVSCYKPDPGTGRSAPGHFASRFSSFADANGCRISMRITSEVILTEGKNVFAEYAIDLVENNALDTVVWRRSL